MQLMISAKFLNSTLTDHFRMPRAWISFHYHKIGTVPQNITNVQLGGGTGPGKLPAGMCFAAGVLKIHFGRLYESALVPESRDEGPTQWVAERRLLYAAKSTTTEIGCPSRPARSNLD
jgi:hypothetical protein